MKRIRTGLMYVRRSPYQAMAIVFVMAVTFFVSTLIALLVYGSTQLLAYFETRPQIIAFLKPDTQDSQVQSLKSKYETDSRVKDLKVVSKEEAFAFYKGVTSDNPLLAEFVSPATFSPSLEMSVYDLAEAQPLIANLETEDSVESVGFTAAVGGEAHLDSVIEKLKNITSAVRISGLIIVSILVLTSLLVLLVVMSMRISMRRAEMTSLSFLGATRGFIRSPILVEAAIYAILGVLLGWFSAGVTVMYASPTLIRYFGDLQVLPHSLPMLLQILGAILAIELLVGLIIAVIGATAAVARSLRMVQ